MEHNQLAPGGPISQRKPHVHLERVCTCMQQCSICVQLLQGQASPCPQLRQLPCMRLLSTSINRSLCRCLVSHASSISCQTRSGRYDEATPQDGLLTAVSRAPPLRGGQVRLRRCWGLGWPLRQPGAPTGTPPTSRQPPGQACPGGHCCAARWRSARPPALHGEQILLQIERVLVSNLSANTSRSHRCLIHLLLHSCSTSALILPIVTAV